ncbi:MAG TPA: hypothetical protein VIP11_25825 [Gemmatimonadaceae bacterium]
MGTGKGVLQGYTGAAAVDARHQIILADMCVSRGEVAVSEGAEQRHAGVRGGER